MRPATISAGRGASVPSAPTITGLRRSSLFDGMSMPSNFMVKPQLRKDSERSTRTSPRVMLAESSAAMAAVADGADAIMTIPQNIPGIPENILFIAYSGLEYID